VLSHTKYIKQYYRRHCVVKNIRVDTYAVSSVINIWLVERKMSEMTLAIMCYVRRPSSYRLFACSLHIIYFKSQIGYEH
jgi:hypothetical protein